MGLRKYLAKRHFDRTPEPKGRLKTSKSKRLAFVVQEHHASQLHYDFRLELDGVLKSWAVPKGPSLNPEDHHLAVHVEDHPYEYRTFEGVIPEGSYGAGNVIIWDEGYYEPRAETDDPEATLRQELNDGHLTFVMHGKKLKGEFALIKMHGDDDKAWLLVKKHDAYASKTDITKQDTSVETGRKVDDLGAANKVPDLAGYPRVAEPWKVHPMLCTLVDESFSKTGWLFEIKWDGYRAIGSKHKNDVQLYSRNDTDFREHYPPVAEALHQLKHDVILDGEIVVIDDQGHPHFEELQSWRKTHAGNLAYYVFDILWCDGRDLREMPLIQRKKILKALIPKRGIIRYSDHVETAGEALFRTMRDQHLEGVVAKRADSAYRENNRGEAWLKIKTHLRQEVVIGGYTEPRGGRKYLGSLLVGLYNKKGEFVYVGHSGGGIPDNQRSALLQMLRKLERKQSPFVSEPKPNAPVHWVKPQLVCEMSFSEWTDDGSMRHPAFEGLRADKKPTAVHKEIPKGSAMPDNHKSKTTAYHEQDSKQSAHHGKQSVGSDDETTIGKVSVTHRSKIFFPKHGYTKGDLIDYYERIAPYILPYIEGRPLSLLRQPNGITGEGFFQKNMEHLPEWVPHVNIYSDSNQEDLHWMMASTKDALLYAVQLGTIEINPWNARAKHLDKPDWAVIDLDPEGSITFNNVIAVAQTVKQVCDEWDIPCYPKTSGKTGIHIFIPLGARYSHEQAKNFVHLLVMEIHKRQPKLTSLERMPAKRPNKIYLDFLQNREGQTLAAPYSARPTPDASVSTPLRWSEVKPGLKPSDFTIKNIEARLKKVGDLWAPVIGKGISLSKLIAALEKAQQSIQSAAQTDTKDT